MIQLLYTVIFTEATMIALLLFKTPLRKLVIMALDRLKRGRGPLMVKTVAVTLVIVLSSSVYSMINIQKRGIEDAAAVNPTDQVLMAKHLLEATLMGMYRIDSFFFFLWIVDFLFFLIYLIHSLWVQIQMFRCCSFVLWIMFLYMYLSSHTCTILLIFKVG
jgi:hypothetical protein